MNEIRWEYGSEFSYHSFNEEKKEKEENNYGSLWGSGRDALKGLIKYGINRRQWRRFWVPSYLCQEVVESVVETGIELCRYTDRPDIDTKERFRDAGVSFPCNETKKGDVILIVNYFGLRDRVIYDRNLYKCDIVEDHTHDPWSNWAKESEADFCIASLRKTLPIPDGGVIWSPTRKSVPCCEATTVEHANASFSKLAGMILKTHYLNGETVKKDEFRKYLVEGESRIGNGLVSGITPFTAEVLKNLPIKKWREKRKKNFNSFSSMISKKTGFRVFVPETERCVPFCVAIMAENEKQRNIIRKKMIEKSIYPAVLWSLDNAIKSVEGNIDSEDLAMSKRVLMLHCDFRYESEDFKKVIGALSGVY